MEEKVLIAYASTYGSTGEIAEYLGEVLRESGFEVDVGSVQDVSSVSPYQVVIIGSSVRMDKLLPAAVKFAEKHRMELREKKTAYFAVGATMKEDTPENRRKAEEFLRPLAEIKPPLSTGRFAGKIDYGSLGAVWRFMAKKDDSGFMAEGDFRDWDLIYKWIRDLIPLLKQKAA